MPETNTTLSINYTSIRKIIPRFRLEQLDGWQNHLLRCSGLVYVIEQDKGAYQEFCFA